MFRRAELSDVERLWRWRLEAEKEGAEGGWYEGRPTTWETHCEWFSRSLLAGPPEILVWEENLKPHGVLRVESDGAISFYVPRRFRGDGVGKRLLTAALDLAENYGGRLKATVDAGNLEAWDELRGAGFREYPVKFLAYKR